MSTSTPTIPPDVAAHVLWHLGQKGGQQPGTFTQHLIAAIASADMNNAARLEQIYPEYVTAVMGAKLDPNGITRLQNLAGLRCINCGDTDGPFAAAGFGYVCEPCLKAGQQ